MLLGRSWMLCAVVAGAMALPKPAEGETVLILLDNSGSMLSSSAVYLERLAAIMDKFQGTVEVSPIGDSEKPLLVVSSAADLDRLQLLLKTSFQFTDQATKIDGSLARIESTNGFQQASTVIIISDMEPDWDRSTRWAPQDVKDLGDYIDRLRRWTTQEKKDLVLVLHGWNVLPATSTGESFADQVKEAILARRALTASEGLRLLADGLSYLKEISGSRLRILNIPEVVAGVRNEEEMANILSSILGIENGGAVPEAVELKRDFSMRVDFDEEFMLQRKHSVQLESLIGREIFVGPRRTLTLCGPTQGVSPPCDTVDFRFLVLPGDGAEPHYRPDLKVEPFKDADGNLQTISEPKHPQGRLVHVEDAVSWVSAEINTWTRDLIGTHFPVPFVSKTLELRGYDGKSLPRGYRIKVLAEYADGMSQLSRTIGATQADGIVTLEIPTAFRIGRVLLDVRVDGDPEPSSREFEIGRITPEAVKKPSRIPIDVSREHFREVRVASHGQAVRGFVLKCFLEGPSSPPFVTETDAQRRSFVLLPGTYSWETQPSGSEPVLNSYGTFTLLEDLRPGTAKEIDVKFDDDLLADPNTYNDVFNVTALAPDIVLRSPNCFKALFRYTSNKLEERGTDEENIRTVWQRLAETAFRPETQETMMRRLERGMQHVSLPGCVESEEVDPDRAMWNLRTAFDAMAGRRDVASGNYEETQTQVNRYNTWLKEITDSTQNVFMSPRLRDILTVKAAR